MFPATTARPSSPRFLNTLCLCTLVPGSTSPSSRFSLLCLQAPFGSLALEKPSPLSPTWCSPSWEHKPHCVGMDTVTQGVGENPSRAKPHPRCSRPSYFYLANTALSTSSEETSSICFMLTCAAGLSYLLHFCFTLGVFLMSRKNVCGGSVQTVRPPH